MENIASNLENVADVPRVSMNMWTPARCQNSALHDDHGKAFYDFDEKESNGTPTSFTPRRSARFRPIVHYPLELRVRCRSKIKKVKTEEATTQRAGDRSDSATSMDEVKPDCKLEELGLLHNLFDEDSPKREASEDEVKFTAAIETIEIFDSPVESRSAKTAAATPRTVLKNPKTTTTGQLAASSSSRLAVSTAKKLKDRWTPIKSVYSEYFTSKESNANSAVKTVRDSTKKQSNRKNVTLRREVLETKPASRRKLLNGNGEEKPVKRLATPKTRIKMPNFRAIHQNEFDKMVSIVDHVAIRQEKAAKAFDFAPDFTKLQSQNATTPAKRSAAKQKLPTSTNKPATESKQVKARKRIEISKIPIFLKNSEDKLPGSVVEFKESSKPGTIREDKIGERRKKNMTIYKSGFQHTKKTEIIRGVRSNRRFDLQMLYRDSLK